MTLHQASAASAAVAAAAAAAAASAAANAAATVGTAAAVKKLGGFDFYRQVLHSPKLVVAPMVDQSEYAWRLLSRRYDAQLCYTPMFHAKNFADSKKYRDEVFSTGTDDHPLVVQFCANDPQILLAAAKLVEDRCDAVDINLGCPQGIAKRGHYGSFLQDEWDLVASMVRILHENLSVPVTCKIRVFPDPERTLQYAKMLQDAGCQLLTVHGRTREQKAQMTGLADWTQIKMVKEALSIPVFANGNILYREDVDRCLAETGVDGVMVAEANLYNPAVFTGKHYPAHIVAQQYLDICQSVPGSADAFQAKAHLFKMFHAIFPLHEDLRQRLVASNNFETLEGIVADVRSRYEADPATSALAEFDVSTAAVSEAGIKTIPTWLLQPYVRPLLKAESKDNEQSSKAEQQDQPADAATDASQVASTDDQSKMSKTQRKRLEKRKAVATPTPGSPNASRSATAPAADSDKQAVAAADGTKRGQKRPKRELCGGCSNVCSVKCAFKMCKGCCRTHARTNAESIGMTEGAEGQPFVCEVHKTSLTPKPRRDHSETAPAVDGQVAVGAAMHCEAST
ncbi:dihydrouridine synthase-domain-containing protein [Entophlyctis helioformis]|nr:dihydrouridine synthase-domain-containing protein [Entophlyctis helioformis]